MASGRVETGPVRFGDDWAGVFIRGDEAFHLALKLGGALERLPASNDIMDALQRSSIEGLVELLHSCREPCDAQQIGLACATEPTPSSLDREIL